MFDPYLSQYFVPTGSKLLSVDDSGDYYYDGKMVVGCRSSTYIDQCQRCLAVTARLSLDDGTVVVVRTFDNLPPTTVVPRAYRKHVNQQPLEDIF